MKENIERRYSDCRPANRTHKKSGIIGYVFSGIVQEMAREFPSYTGDIDKNSTVKLIIHENEEHELQALVNIALRVNSSKYLDSQRFTTLYDHITSVFLHRAVSHKQRFCHC